MIMGFRKGDRVRLSAAGRHLVRPPLQDRIGTVKNEPTRSKYITVTWEGHSKTTERQYSPTFLEQATDRRPGDAPERGVEQS